MIKRILILALTVFLFTLPVSAETDFYSEQYEISGAERLKDYLPENVQDYFGKNNLDPKNPLWTGQLKPENVFTHIWGFLRSGAKAPISSGAVILSIILISAALGGMDLKGEAAIASGYAVALTAAAAITVPIYSVVNASIGALKGCATFMTAFIPIFAVIVTASGKAATSLSMSGLLLGACSAVNFISDFCVMPLMGGYLAISIASSVSPLLGGSGIASGIKKICYFTMSLLTTVFLGILSIQTAVNASADTLSLKTAKFIIGSAVPVAGTALSEALTTVTASMGVLKTSLGMYGVVACAMVFLPLLAESLMWRLVFNLTAVISDLFGVAKISAVLKGADTVLSVLIGIMMLTAAMFIISLGVVLK